MSMFDALREPTNNIIKDVFGDVVIYNQTGQAVQTVTAIFQANYELISIIGEQAISSFGPVFDIVLADLPFVPKKGDTVTHESQNYEVIELQPQPRKILLICFEA